MDETTFRALVDEHFADLWRFARRRCRSGTDADDVVAETLATAWRRRADLPGGDEARLWLYGAARRVLANQRRSNGRFSRLRERVGAGAAVAPPVPDPADVAAGRTDGALRAALETLSETDRELLLMRAWDGLAVTEMATLLDITPNAVSVRLTKARTRLAAALGVEGEATTRPPVTSPLPAPEVATVLDRRTETDRGSFRTSTDRSPAPEGGAR